MTRLISFLGLALVLVAACGGGGAKTSGTGPTPVEQGGPPPKGAELTTAEAVMEASLTAQGGRERMGKLKAMRQTGTFAIVEAGIKGPATITAAPPRNLVVWVELPGVGKIGQGMSGDVGWDLNPVTGARLLTGAELAQNQRDAQFNAEESWKEIYPKAELAGVVEFAGQQAYKVVLTASDGDTKTRYFAKDTLLPLGSERVAKTQMGEMASVEILSDWREVGGIKYAHKTQLKQAQATIEIIVEKVEPDPKLDPSAFALPPEIAALQKPATPAKAVEPAKPPAKK